MLFRSYYTEQRRSLRPTTYRRLHQNDWVTAESTFLTPELWDACVDPAHRPLLPSKDDAEFVAVDVGLKSDNAAVVRVRVRENRIVLAGYRLWKPTKAEPLNLEETIETYLREVRVQNWVRRILIDPWQAARSIQTLKATGLPIEEFPQTVANTTRMAQALYDVLKGRNLVLFEDDELRQQALNTVAIETPRGYRIAKEKASRKIDAIVALSMAIVAALDMGGRVLRAEDIFFPQDLVGAGAALDDAMVTVGSQKLDPDLAAEVRGARVSGGGWRPIGR